MQANLKNIIAMTCSTEPAMNSTKQCLYILYKNTRFYQAVQSRPQFYISGYQTGDVANWIQGMQFL